MITFYLAAVLLLQLDKHPPMILAPFTSQAACVLAAIKANEGMQHTKETDELGAAYVCLKIVTPDA